MGKWMFLLLLGGCGSTAAQPIGPDAQAQESALAIVWEGAYAMEQSSRPTSIKWWSPDGCGEDLDITGQTLAGTCAADSEGSNGDVYIRWQGSISASNWSRALVMWRQYLMTGAMTRPSADDFALVSAADGDLKSVGL